MEQDTIVTDHVKVFPASINPKRPPKNLKDAKSREDSKEWALGRGI